MLIMRKLLYVLFTTATISMVIGSSCKKDPTKNATLPPVTQEGKNTVGFTINGEVWVPYSKCQAFSNPCSEMSASYGVSGGAAPNSFDFQIARHRGSKSSSLTVSSSSIGTITSVGNKIDSIGVNFTGENWTGNSDSYSGISTGSKFIITRFDRQAKIISGEFEFILNEDNRSGKSIILKDGRFDFKFNACTCSK